jgi:hypothetical protein
VGDGELPARVSRVVMACARLAAGKIDTFGGPEWVSTPVDANCPTGVTTIADSRLSSGPSSPFQERRLGNRTPGVLVVLVPTRRKAKGDRVLMSVHSERDAAPTEKPDAGATKTAIATIVVTWDEWLDVRESAVQRLPATPDSLAADLVQLRSLCRTPTGTVIDPVPVGMHRERFKDLCTLVDQVTRRMGGDGVLPSIRQEVGYDTIRDIPRGHGAAAASVGVALRLADAGLRPLWLRCHKITDQLSAIRARIMTSRFADDVRTDEDLASRIRGVQATISAPGWGL